jgi:hypothetical protein
MRRVACDTDQTYEERELMVAREIVEGGEQRAGVAGGVTMNN